MSPVTDATSTITAGTVTYQLMFPEPVLPGTIGLDDFVFDTYNGTVTPTAVSAAGVGSPVDGGYSTVAVTMTLPAAEGLLEAALASTATVLDVAGNNFVFLNGSTGTSNNIFEADIDNVHPTVTSITRVADPDTNVQNDTGDSSSDGVTDADVLTFRVDFSEPVDAESLFQEIDGSRSITTSRFDLVALQASDGTDVASSFTDAQVSVAFVGGPTDFQMMLAEQPTSVLVTVSGTDIAGFDGSIGIATGSGITDAHGHPLAGLAVGVSPETYTLDNTAPTVTVDVDRATLNNNFDSATVTFTFDEPVDGLDYADITVPASGSLTNLSEASPNDGTVWTATLTANSAVDLSGQQFAVSGFADQFGQTNDGTGNTSDSFDIDTVAPTVTVSLSSSAIKAGDTVTVTLNASEPLIGLGTRATSFGPQLTSAGSLPTQRDRLDQEHTPRDADVDDPTNVITLLAGEAIDVAGNTNAALCQRITWSIPSIQH